MTLMAELCGREKKIPSKMRGNDRREGRFRGRVREREERKRYSERENRAYKREGERTERGKNMSLKNGVNFCYHILESKPRLDNQSMLYFLEGFFFFEGRCTQSLDAL